MDALLTYDRVEIVFDGRPVVRDVSLALHPGEILGLVGESGSGKSTLIRAAMGLLGAGGAVVKGDIRFEGKSLPDLRERELRRLRGAGLGMIFQDAGASLCPIRTIGAQILESLAAHRKISAGEAKRDALALFEQLGLRDGERVWRSYPFELSGGMNQRAAIAMAVLLRPRALLADEPTSALDAVSRRQVMEQLLQVRQLFGTAIILVTHDIGVVSAAADTVLVLEQGCCREHGPAAAVLQAPQAAYTQKLLAAVPRLRRNE